LETLGSSDDRFDTRLDALGRLDTRLDALGRLDTRLDALGRFDTRLDALGRFDTRLDALGRFDTRLDALERLGKFFAKLSEGISFITLLAMFEKELAFIYFNFKINVLIL
jgi:hypothetical protein